MTEENRVENNRSLGKVASQEIGDGLVLKVGP